MPVTRYHIMNCIYCMNCIPSIHMVLLFGTSIDVAALIDVPKSNTRWIEKNNKK